MGSNEEERRAIIETVHAERLCAAPSVGRDSAVQLRFGASFSRALCLRKLVHGAHVCTSATLH